MSLASLWVTWKRHQHQVGYAIVGILLFAAGWQTGRVMSPYYAASPIVFEEAPGTPVGASGGSTEALVALQEAGQQNTPQVAAATTSAPAAGGGEGALPSPSLPSPSAFAETTTKLFVGSKNSNLYHHKTCPSAKRIKEENQIWWPTKEAAEAAGYMASKCTKDLLK